MDAEDEEKLLEYVFRAMKALERIAEAVEAKPSLQGQPSLTYPVMELSPGFVRAPVKFDEDIEEQYYRLSKTV
jgi:hypothetical protein